jgi:hypothetical protein
MIEELILCKFVFDKENNLDWSEKIYNNFGNFCLAPARFLFNGATYKINYIRTRSDGSKDFAYMRDNKSDHRGERQIFRTILSIIFFVPGTLFGLLFRTKGMLSSDKLNRRYQSLGEIVDKPSKENALKAIQATLLGTIAVIGLLALKRI